MTLGELQMKSKNSMNFYEAYFKRRMDVKNVMNITNKHTAFIMSSVIFSFLFLFLSFSLAGCTKLSKPLQLQKNHTNKHQIKQTSTDDFKSNYIPSRPRWLTEYTNPGYRV